MQALAGLAIATLVIVSIAVGIRLVGLHRRSGGLPELLLGLMLLLCVGLGYPLRIASVRVGPEAAGAVMAISSLAIALGYTCLISFTWRVFRQHSRWGRAAAVVASALLLATGVWDALDALIGSDPHQPSAVNTQSVIFGATVTGTYLWAAWESLRYRAIMTRRLRLGLADPVVSNRLLLWGLMCVIVTAGIALNAVAMFRGLDVAVSPVVLLGSSTTGLCQAILLVLAFVPPPAYLAWVRGPAAPEPA